MSRRNASNEDLLNRILAAGATQGGLRKAWWALADQIEDCCPPHEALEDWDVLGQCWVPAAWAIDFDNSKDEDGEQVVIIEVVMFEVGPLSAQKFWSRAASVEHLDSSSYNKVCLVSVCDGLVALWRHVEEIGMWAGLPGHDRDLLPRPTWTGTIDDLIEGMADNGVPHHVRFGPDILVVPNRHPCAHRGTLIEAGGAPFTSYFVGGSGDQWIFNFDGENTAILSGGDVDWARYEVPSTGVVMELVLDAPEQMWVAACAGAVRERQALARARSGE